MMPIGKAPKTIAPRQCLLHPSGLLFHSSFIGRAQQKNKGRISRYLANKCSIASRIDCFSDFSTQIYGEKLKDQVEDRLAFLTEGKAPKKNADVMLEALAEVRGEDYLITY